MKIFFKIFFLLLTAAAVYTAFTSYNPVREGMSAAVVNKSSGDVVDTIPEGRRFILYNALCWKYSVEMFSLKNSLAENIRIDIPALKDLKEDTFAVMIPIKADFSVKPSELYDLNLLKNAADGVKKAVVNELKINLNLAIEDYLAPVYRGDVIKKESETIIKRLEESISTEFANKGITIYNLKYMGAVSAPDNRRYEEGLVHLRILRTALIENERKLIELKGQLERDAVSMESIHNKYREMSLIISKNPDILKYIYIDKIAPNSKLVVSPDKNGFPAFIGNGKNDQKTAADKNVEIEAAPKDKSVDAE
jgi:hypothetical protein